MTDHWYKQALHCRACGSGKLVSILNLGQHALTGRFPAADEPDPRVAPLELVMCDVTASPGACGLIQLAHTCELSEMYGPTYGYRSSITKTMVGHLHRTATDIMNISAAKRGDWILEVGSNDGTIQNFLANRGFNLVAMDPSAQKFADNYPADSKLIVDFFSAKKASISSSGNKFKAIISIAMFYDLEQPLEFMKDVRELLDKDGIWCCEQAYLPAILTSLCYDTICHEHLCYYSLAQFNWMTKKAGLRLIDVRMNDINGGSFAIFACRDDSVLAAKSSAVERTLNSEKLLKLDRIETWTTFARRVRQHRTRIRAFFEDARAAGEVVLGLGASTKGNVLLQYAGITNELMPAIGERDPRKVGLRTPKTRIPIIAESEARALNPQYLFVGPWHFRDEILSRESEFLANGGRIVFPLPRFEVVRKTSLAAVGSKPTASPMINWAKPLLFDDERVLITEALDSTMISGGHFVEEFESKFAHMHGSDQPAISTSNGTTALHLAYLASGIGPGDEVIVPAWGFMAAANMALAIGAIPVFADIDEKHWLIDPRDVAAKIGKKTKAIVAIHTYGNICDMARLGDLARDAGIALIEDCAESLGSQLNGKLCGTFSDVATFSFQATKTVTCGEGGAIFCRSPEVADRARLIRNHGMIGRKRYWHHEVGHNFRLTNLQCAMLCAQLEHWSEITFSRARLYDGYHSRLSDIAGVQFQTFGDEITPLVWAVGIRLLNFDESRRDRLLDMMLEAGIECRPGFYTPSAQPIYKAQKLKWAEQVASQIIVPPIDPTLTDQALDYICQTLRQGIVALS